MFRGEDQGFAIGSMSAVWRVTGGLSGCAVLPRFCSSCRSTFLLPTVASLVLMFAAMLLR
jgi:hypothetical protein